MSSPRKKRGRQSQGGEAALAEEKAMCPICRCEVSRAQTVELPCSHSHCLECYTRMAFAAGRANRAVTCALCRGPLFGIGPEDTSSGSPSSDDGSESSDESSEDFGGEDEFNKSVAWWKCAGTLMPNHPMEPAHLYEGLSLMQGIQRDRFWRHPEPDSTARDSSRPDRFYRFLRDLAQKYRILIPGRMSPGGVVRDRRAHRTLVFRFHLTLVVPSLEEARLVAQALADHCHYFLIDDDWFESSDAFPETAGLTYDPHNDAYPTSLDLDGRLYADMDACLRRADARVRRGWTLLKLVAKAWPPRGPSTSGRGAGGGYSRHWNDHQEDAVYKLILDALDGFDVIRRDIIAAVGTVSHVMHTRIMSE